MRDKGISKKQTRIWRMFVMIFFFGLIGGAVWAVNKYIPPQHLFWKPLDTNRPLGFATKQQLFTLNFKPSSSCMNLVRDTAGYKTVIADPKRPASGAGKGVCGWDVARVVYGTEDVFFAPGESNMQCPLSVAVFLWQREVDAYTITAAIPAAASAEMDRVDGRNMPLPMHGMWPHSS